MEHLHWYAAYHNESHHPHVHLIVYSSDPSEGYLTKQGVAIIRSSVADEIFAQDLQSAYEKQTAYRNKLRGGSRKLITDVIARIHTGGYDNPEMEQLLTEIADRLHHTSGKLVYGYLPKGTKGLIDKAVDLLAADERIAELYNLWYEQKEEILRTYNKKLPQRLPLSQNQEFKSIRNAVVQEALHLTADRRLSLADEPEPEISGDAVEPAAEPALPDRDCGTARRSAGYRAGAAGQQRQHEVVVERIQAGAAGALRYQRAPAGFGTSLFPHAAGGGNRQRVRHARHGQDPVPRDGAGQG